MAKITENFDRAEYDVNEPVPPMYERNLHRVALLVQWMRDLLGAPGVVRSCYRSPERNARVGGASSSAHLTASAADVSFLGVTDRTVVERVLEEIRAGRAPADLGLVMIYDSSSHVHIGHVRGTQRHVILRRTSKGDVVVRSAAEVPVVRPKA